MKQKLLVTLCAGFVIVASGCAHDTAVSPGSHGIYQPGGQKNPEQVVPDIYPDGVSPAPEPVIREGRYRIVSTKPSAEQRDLLAQIINFEAQVIHTTVKSALDVVVSGSGYRVCSAGAGSSIEKLYSLPLPQAHRKIGPVTLRNAIQVLAGPAYSVEVDETVRGICFKVRPDYKEPVIQQTLGVNQ